MVQAYMSKLSDMHEYKVLEDQLITTVTLYKTYIHETNDVVNWVDNTLNVVTQEEETVIRNFTMVNKHTYKPSLKDIMDKYYEMFRGKNQTNKTDLFNSPEDSDTDGWTRLTRRWVLSGEEWVADCVREKPVCHLLRLHSLSFVKISD